MTLDLVLRPNETLLVLPATYAKTLSGSNGYSTDIQLEGLRQEMLDTVIVVLAAKEFS